MSGRTLKTQEGKPERAGGRPPLALVTGASSGIGRAFARRLGGDGYNLVVVGRRRERLEELELALPKVKVRPLVADLGTDAGIEAVAAVCASEELTLLVNNAGVAHYMPFIELPADKANELLHVKVVAPTMLARAVAPGMVARGEGTIINVSGMLAFSGPAPIEKLPLRRAVYTGTLAHIVALSQVLHEELKAHGLRVQALCPGVVATEFHERQGLDLSAVPRMSADDVVTASLRALAIGEVLCAPVWSGSICSRRCSPRILPLLQHRRRNLRSATARHEPSDGRIKPQPCSRVGPHLCPTATSWWTRRTWVDGAKSSTSLTYGWRSRRGA